MAISLNKTAVSNLRSLIRAGKVDATSAWSFDADDGNALLGKNGDDWDAYAAVHLGLDSDAPEHTKAHYKYPAAKGGKVYLAGLRGDITRAAQNGADDIEQMARKLLAEAKPDDASEHAAFDAEFEAAQKPRYASDAPVSWDYRGVSGYGYVESSALRDGNWYYKIRQVDNHVGADGKHEPKFVFHFESDMHASTKAAVEKHAATADASHAGFDDWIEIFAAGKHTDSAGQSRTWSRTDLDQIIANHNAAQPAPLVIGHPKTDSPAWGWTAALKRVGGKLLAKFAQVPGSLADAVRDGRYRNRSVKLAHESNGWRLIHVGLLGAAAPAVEGLKPIAFDAEPVGVTYQFDAFDAAGLSLIARGMQKLRELIIAHFGADEADRYVPQSDIDQLNDIADASADTAPDSPQPAFSRPSDEDHAMDEKLKADFAAEQAKRQAAEKKLAEFAAREREQSARQFVDQALAEGRLLPAQAQGLAEFIAGEADDATVEFAAGEETVKKSRSEYLRGFIASLPKQIALGRKSENAEAVGDDPGAIIKAAKEFQAAESVKGMNVPWHEAVSHVTRAQQ